MDEVYGLIGKFWTDHAMTMTDDAPFEMTDAMVAEDCESLNERYLKNREENEEEDGLRP